MSAAALATAALSYGRGAYAQTVSCDVTASDTYQLSSTRSQAITVCGDPVEVIAEDGVSINAADDPDADAAVSLFNDKGGNVTFTDSAEGSDLTGSRYGLKARAIGNGQISITSNGNVAATDSYGTGIETYGKYGNTEITVTGTVTGETGVRAGSSAGDVSVNVTGTVDGLAYGVAAYSEYGDVSITVDGGTLKGLSGGASYEGDVLIDIREGSSTEDIVARSAFSDVTITNAGDVAGTGSGQHFFYGNGGISAMSNGGRVEISNSGTVSGAHAGINVLQFSGYSSNKYSAETVIKVSDGSVTGGDYGILARSVFGGKRSLQFDPETIYPGYGAGSIDIEITGDADSETIISGDVNAIEATTGSYGPFFGPTISGSEELSVRNHLGYYPTGTVSVRLDGNVETRGGIAVGGKYAGVYVGREVTVGGDITDVMSDDNEFSPSQYSRTIVANFGEVTGGISLGAGSDIMIQGIDASVAGKVDGGSNPFYAGKGMKYQDALLFLQREGLEDENASAGAYGSGAQSEIDISTIDFDGNDEGEQFVNFETVGISGEDVILTNRNDDAGLLLVGGGVVVDGTASNLGVFADDKYGDAGGFIGGSGVIGGLSGDLVIAPGNRGRRADGRLGTLTVTGDVDLTGQAGFPYHGSPALTPRVAVSDSADQEEPSEPEAGILQVDVTADGATDLLDVGGRAMLTGANLSINSLGRLEELKNPRSRIIAADGGVTGEFGNVESNLHAPDLTVSPSYGEDHVDLVWQLDEDNLTDKTVFGASSGAALSLSRVFNTSLRLQGLSGPGSSTGSSPEVTRGRSPTAGLSPNPDLASETGYAVFSDVMGETLDVDADENPGYEADTSGLSLGIEFEQFLSTGRLRFGAAASYLTSDVRVATGAADIKSHGIGTFAAFQSGALTISGALTYSDLSFNTFRELGAFDGTGSTDGSSTTASIEMAYDVAPRFNLENASLSPFTSLQAVHTQYDGFAETGSTLTVEGNEIDTQFLEAGIHYEGSFQRGGVLMRPMLSLGLEHAMGDLSSVTVSNVGVGGDLINETAEIDRNRLNIGAGMTFDNGALQTQIRYDGTLGDDSRQHTATLGLLYKF